MTSQGQVYLRGLSGGTGNLRVDQLQGPGGDSVALGGGVLPRAHNLNHQDSELSLEKRVLVRTLEVIETRLGSLGKKGEFSGVYNHEEGDGIELSFRLFPFFTFPPLWVPFAIFQTNITQSHQKETQSHIFWSKLQSPRKLILIHC